MGERPQDNASIDMKVLRQGLLTKTRTTQAALAIRWGCSTSTVSQLIAGTMRSLDYEKRFAEYVGAAWEELFTDVPRRR